MLRSRVAQGQLEGARRSWTSLNLHPATIVHASVAAQSRAGGAGFGDGGSSIGGLYPDLAVSAGCPAVWVSPAAAPRVGAPFARRASCPFLPMELDLVTPTLS